MRQQIFHFSLFTFHFLFVPLNCVRKYSRSEKPKKVWFFAHLFVPLHTFYINKVKDNNE